MAIANGFHASPCIFLLPVLSILVLHLAATHEAVDDGFSVDLIHRNSPSSPLYNLYRTSSSTGLRRFYGQRFTGRFGLHTTQSQVSADNGQYLMKLSLGTPPVDIYGLVDTGSDLIWAQCVPCDHCYKQIRPKFDPSKSSTYRKVNCESEYCKKLDTASCVDFQNVCNYTYGYASTAITQGQLAEDTITFASKEGNPVSLNKIAFGCGHNNTGFSETEMGLIGLGRGPMSLVSQIGSSLGSMKFSYCLVPFHTDPNISSKMRFGNGSEIQGDGVVSTPLVSGQDPTYYFVTLNGISVGDTFVPFNSSSTSASKGNMFIDSGTPPTILPQDFYDRLAMEVEKQIEMTPVKDDPELGTQLCYRSNENLKGPILTAHFEGADLQLTPTQTFIPPKDGVFCFAMTNNTANIGIYGNFAQSNFLVGYDIERGVVSFKPVDCTKQ